MFDSNIVKKNVFFLEEPERVLERYVCAAVLLPSPGHPLHKIPFGLYQAISPTPFHTTCTR
jgi:hypothetical protein